MTLARRSAAGRAVRALCLCLAATLALVTLTPAGLAGGAEPPGAAADAGGALAPCHDGSDDTGGGCGVAQPHCAGCILAIVLRAEPEAAPSPRPPVPCPRPMTSRALARPGVPHGPPRPV